MSQTHAYAWMPCDDESISISGSPAYEGIREVIFFANEQVWWNLSGISEKSTERPSLVEDVFFGIQGEFVLGIVFPPCDIVEL